MLAGDPLPGDPIRLDHGRGQFAEFPSLAEVAQNSGTGPYRRDRSAGAKPLRSRQSGRQRPCPLPHPRIFGSVPAEPQSAGMDLSARTEITAVLNGATRPAPRSEPVRKFVTTGYIPAKTRP